MWQVAEHARDGRRTMSFDEFHQRLPAICHSHRAQRRALAFGLVLCDVRQPHLRKALDDDAYWQALDELAGCFLTVFSFEFEPQPRRPSSQSPHEQQWLIGVHHAPQGAANAVLSTHFPGLTVQRLPAVLFFQVTQDGNISDSCAATLLNDPADSAQAYNSLQNVLQVAVASLSRVEEANAVNAREIHQLIVEGLHDLKVERLIRSVFPGLKAMASVGSIARLVSDLV